MLIAAPQVSFQVSELQKASQVFTSGFGAEGLQKLTKASGMTQSTAQAGQAYLNLRIQKKNRKQRHRTTETVVDLGKR